MTYRWIDFFTDPLLRAPTMGSILMCIVASLIGVIVFIRKKSLVGETISHATYPGLVLGAFASSACFVYTEGMQMVFFLGGACISSFLAMFFLHKLQGRFRVKNDAALCCILASFFGVGIVLASRMQIAHPVLYRKVQTFLYGQMATMTDIYIAVYGLLLVFVIVFILSVYPKLRLAYFDPMFARSVGVSLQRLEKIFSFFLVLAVVVASKSVGVVLLSAMLIAPALTARCFTRHLSSLFALAALIAAFCAFLGNYISTQLSVKMIDSHIVFPTGPMIVIIGSMAAFLALVIARCQRVTVSSICFVEMFLVRWYRLSAPISLRGFYVRGAGGIGRAIFIFFSCKHRGWFQKKGGRYYLSDEGKKYAKQTIDAYELWGQHLMLHTQEREKTFLSVKEIYAELGL